MRNSNRNRWQIELFFKWIKQHLKIKKFWGTSENAVRIQIYSAIIAYCMMAIVQKKMNVERSIYEMLQIVSISLTDATPLKDLFAKPNYNIVNELDDSTNQVCFNSLNFIIIARNFYGQQWAKIADFSSDCTVPLWGLSCQGSFFLQTEKFVQHPNPLEKAEFMEREANVQRVKNGESNGENRNKFYLYAERGDPPSKGSLS